MLVPTLDVPEGFRTLYRRVQCAPSVKMSWPDCLEGVAKPEFRELQAAEE